MAAIMKTYNNLLHSLCAAALSLLLAAGLAACTADPIEFDAGSDAAFDPVGEARPGFYSPLADADTLVQVWVKPGDLFQDQITFGLPKEAPEDMTVTIRVADDEEWLKAYSWKMGMWDRELIFSMSEMKRPVKRAFRYIPSGKLSVPSGEMTLKKGSHCITLPLQVDMSETEENCYAFFVMLTTTTTDKEGKSVEYRIRYHLMIDPQIVFNSDHLEDYAAKYGTPIFDRAAILIDPSKIDPRAAREVSIEEFYMDFETGAEEHHYYKCVDDVLILGATVGYDAEHKLPVLQFDGNLTHLLLNRAKYLAPIQQERLKVSIVINGGGMGIGFCNLDDAQRASLVSQIKQAVARYELDGVNLYDEQSGYGREGMAPVDPASYAKFIRDLRAALPDKLITLTDVGEPSATLYEVHDGLQAGAYLDYAWTGTSWDFTDPYTDPVRGTIAGLDRSKYGIAFGRYRDNISNNEQMPTLEKLTEKLAGGSPKILVSEMMPIIRGIESASGITILDSWIQNAVLPALESETAIALYTANSGYSFEYVGTSMSGNSLPEHANFLYYPDWLRF